MADSGRELEGPERSPTPFGRYLLDELIARGGMGEVFRAVAMGAGGFEKPVVVKRILPSLGGVATMSKMFIEEARMMSRLVHPNIVQVIDFGQGERDDYFLVMELVDGVDLRVFGKALHQAREPFPIGLAAFIATQILRGLHFAHTKAYGDGRVLVHRDMSPGNVLLSRVGEVKVADFGVALVAQPEDASPDTMAGKPGYMAPEQVFGAPVDGRADVFSVGVVLHQMLTGGPAFEGEGEVQQQASAALGRIRDIEALRPEVGPDLAAVVRQALAAEPADRFANARAMSKAIEAACRATDIELATADELAEHVERVADARRRRKKVVPLAEEPVQRELTRTGAFTMRVTDVSNVTSVTSYSTVVERSPLEDERGMGADDAEVPSRVETPPPSLPLRSSGLSILVVGAIASVAVGGLVWWLATAPESTAGTPPAPSAALSATAQASAAALPTPFTPTSSPSTASRSASSSRAAVSSSGPVPPAPRTTQHPTPPSAAPTSQPPSAPSEVSPASCSGKVLLSSRGSWWVSGGPSGRVQSPGVYTWRCGSYALTGTSRVDGKVVSRGVAVREGATAAARFE